MADELIDTQEQETPALDPRMAVKALGQNRVGGYLVIWGDAEHKDLTGEFFTPETKGLLDIFSVTKRLPSLYHHGLDDAVKWVPVGVMDVMEPDEIGLWVEHQLDRGNKYKDAVLDLVRQGALGQSSGTTPQARKVADDGRIEQWPIFEGSLTPTPCEPRMITERPLAEIKAAFDATGIAFPDQTDKATDEAEPVGDEESRQAELDALGLAFDFLAIETE